MRRKEFGKVNWNGNFCSAKQYSQGSAEYLEIMFNFWIYLFGENFEQIFLWVKFSHVAKDFVNFPQQSFS